MQVGTLAMNSAGAVDTGVGWLVKTAGRNVSPIDDRADILPKLPRAPAARTIEQAAARYVDAEAVTAYTPARPSTPNAVDVVAAVGLANSDAVSQPGFAAAHSAAG
jgi:hypothetical protein